MKLRFTIPGAPRTKKTSDVMNLRGVRPIKIPSGPYREWFQAAMSYSPILRGKLAAKGAELPVTVPVGVQALFYCENAVLGDLHGYMQGLADWMQSPRWSKGRPPKLIRNGAGIIEDDKQIEDWDGSRRFIDREAPRVEVCIRLLGEEPPKQKGLKL